MATAPNAARPIPESYYYSGQGRLAIGDRDPVTGDFSNVEFVGNVTSLTIDIATTKFEHKESMSGQRAIDRTIVQEKNATFGFTAESLILDLLSIGLYGASKGVSAGTIVAEEHVVIPGKAIPLKHPNVSDVVLTAIPAGGGAGTVVNAATYTIDEGFGTVYIPANSALTKGSKVTISYAHGKYDQIDAFTQGTPPERYLRFEGLNTVNGDLRLIEIPRAAFDPLTGLEFINEELGSGEFAGNVLPDLTITTKDNSQFFRERRVAVPATV